MVASLIISLRMLSQYGCVASWHRLGAAVWLMLLVASKSLSAECFTPNAEALTSELAYERVFSGTVTAIDFTSETGMRVTFEVDRVWKGAVSKTFVLYIWGLEVEVPRFELGKRYLATAVAINAAQRNGVSLPETARSAFTSPPCGAMDYDYARTSGTIAGLGAGRPPTRTTIP